MRWLMLATVLLLGAGCAGTPVVDVRTIHVDRAEIILAEQGIEENQTALQILMEAFVPSAEVAAAVMQPWVGAVVVGVHGFEAFSEKVGDAGGDRIDTRIFEGLVSELNIAFHGNGLPQSLVIKMQETQPE